MEWEAAPSPMATMPIEVDQHGQPIDRDNPLRTKRSLKRLFTRSRQHETPRPKTPTTPTAAYPIPPAKPAPLPLAQAITSDQPDDPEHDRWSHKRSISVNRDLPVAESEANGTTETLGPEPRNSTSTTRSAKITNFSRPSRDRRHTLSVDETRSSTTRMPAMPASTRSSQGSRPSVSLSQKQSQERLGQKPSLERLGHRQQLNALNHKSSLDRLAYAPATRPSPPRPRTATPDGRLGAIDDVPRLPFMPRAAKGVPAELIGHAMTAEEMRASMRSGTSTWSSGLDSGSTKHSSVFTKMSSARDSATTTDMSDVETPKYSMTVDDAIELYSRGFQDEAIDLQLQAGPSTGKEPNSASAQIAQAMQEPLSGKSHAKLSTSKGQLKSSSPPNSSQAPPPLSRPTATHDQYGFRKASREVAVTEYDAWHKEYCKTQARRTSRWISLMKSHNLPTTAPEQFPPRSAKVQRYVRKGVPPMWRGALWWFYASGDSYMSRFPGLYDTLVVASSTPQLSEGDKEAIDRDIHRTFPDNIHFKSEHAVSESDEPRMLSSLRRLLYAFAIHHPRIGYCQSLNFLAGLLLLFLPEEKAFWLLHIITVRYLPGTHEISLEGANVDLWVLMLALQSENSTVWAKIGGESGETDAHGAPTRLPPVSLCTTPWFMSLFIGTLPIESVLRVWDLIFYDGSLSIFRTALAIFRIGEADIIRVHDPMEIFQVVQTLPRKLLDATLLTTVAMRRGAVGGPWIERKRRERRAWYAAERAVQQQRQQQQQQQPRRPSDAAPATMFGAGPGADAGRRATEAQVPVMRHLSAARSAGDLTRTKSRGLFTRRSASRQSDRTTPLPPLQPFAAAHYSAVTTTPVTPTAPERLRD